MHYLVYRGRNYPVNYICLFLFTLFTSIMVATVTAFYDPYTVLGAVAVTATMTFGLTVFACQTKYDFTSLAPYFFMFFLSITLGTLIFCLLPLAVPDKYSPALYRFWCVIGVMMFSFYIVWDVQLIVGGQHRIQYSVDDYIIASMILYLDIINLFLKVLELMGNRN
jgi:FtsH-binding integral membrane protein